VVAFYGSFLALVIVVALVFAYGRKRKLGTPITWGEAVVGGLALFAIMFLAYGTVPNQWLLWASGKYLNWRSDAVGIPAGPLHKILSHTLDNHWYSGKRNVLFPNGITFFGRGRVRVVKEHVRDAIAAGFYIVFLGAQMSLWTAWQRRGKKAAEKAAIAPVSSYGRPLVKKA
jgi:hypothetical protein